MKTVVIIGAGISGAALAYTLSQYDVRVVVLEKENDVALGASRANSAIIHGGFDPKPGTLMAKLNVQGTRMAPALCQALDVPYQHTGSLVLAFSEEDKKVLDTLLHQGEQNGISDLQLLTGDEARRREPHLSADVTAALFSPTSGIVMPWEYALAMVEVAVQNGAELHLSTAATGARQNGHGGWIVETDQGEIEADYVVNCAGVWADVVHDWVAPHTFATIPTRGEYDLLDKAQGQLVNAVIFQSPDHHGKGVLVAPTVHGNLLIGPNAEEITDREDTRNTGHGLAFVREKALRAVPALDFRQVIRSFAGIRANTDREDFIIDWAAPGFLDCAGIRSPGLSAAPAMGLYMAELLGKNGLALDKKPNWDGTRRVQRPKELPPEQWNQLIKEDARYGRVICRCETITEGEIVAACHGPVPPRSVDGVKRRAGTGMGRCQGGFCGPRVVEILARERGVSPEEIVQDRVGSALLTGDTKGAGEGRRHGSV